MTMEWAAILDVVWDIVEACGADVKLTVDPDVLQAMAVETCLIIAGVIWR